MRVTLIRHAATDANEHHRYLGRHGDEPLSAAGRTSCVAARVYHVDRVFSSPLRRAIETCRLTFPGATITCVCGLEEFDFGRFEGHTAAELAGDAAYRAWVDGFCLGRCPDGEDRASFDARSNAALSQLLLSEHERGATRTVVVCHGGNIMAAMAAFAPRPPEGDGYFSWGPGNLGGYAFEAIVAKDSLAFTDVGRIERLRGVIS